MENYNAELRERVTRLEQDMLNTKDNINTLRSEIHSINDKMDAILNKLNNLAMQQAKWIGAGAVLIFIGQLLVNKFM